MDKEYPFFDARLILNKQLSELIYNKANHEAQQIIKTYRLNQEHDYLFTSNIVLCFTSEQNNKNKLMIIAQILVCDSDILRFIGKVVLPIHFVDNKNRDEIINFCVLSNELNEDIILGNFTFYHLNPDDCVYVYISDKTAFAYELQYSLSGLTKNDMLWNIVFENNYFEVYLMIDKYINENEKEYLCYQYITDFKVNLLTTCKLPKKQINTNNIKNFFNSNFKHHK